MRRFLFLTPVFLLMSVCLYYILTTSVYVRYWVDDYCAAIPVRNGGLWGAQVGWWLTWTGRYSYIFFLNIFELIGPWVVRFIPILLLTSTILALVPVFSFQVILAPLFVFLTLINSPNLIQTFYWQTGAFNYMAEFIFLNLFFAQLTKPKTKLAMVFAFILLFIAGGFSEAYALTQIILVLFILLIECFNNFSNKKLRIKILISGLVGSLLSIGVMSLSPGNNVRASISDQPESIYFIFKSTFYGTKWYLERMLLIKPFLISLLLSFSIIFLVVHNKWKTFLKLNFNFKDMIWIMSLSILTLILTTASVIFTGYYATAYTPPERTMFISIYTIFITFFVFSFSFSLLLIKIISKKIINYFVILAILLTILSSLFLIKSTISHWSRLRGEIKAYAIEYEIQEKKLINASKNNEDYAIINNVKSVGQLDDFIQNKSWVLGCLRAYYNLKDIKLE